MLKELSKKQQRLIKALRQSKTARMKKRCFLVEGLKSVEEVIDSDYNIKFIVLSNAFLDSKDVFLNKLKKKISEDILYQVSEKTFIELTDTVTPQGILAVTDLKDVEIDDMLKNNFLIIALDKIQDPGNMGTIIRTADAAGANGIVIGKGCVDIYNPKVVRSAMGSLFHIPIVQTDDLSKTLAHLKQRGGQVVTTHLSAKKDYYNVNFKTSTVIVMGLEADGVSQKIST
ncbi:MAG: RNA methyltransferase, partial [Thermoanaerobacteraceae bacterium]|nr:RNA methyltransferase [Thermoanaerobacteraceae bacterium]